MESLVQQGRDSDCVEEAIQLAARPRSPLRINGERVAPSRRAGHPTAN